MLISRNGLRLMQELALKSKKPKPFKAKTTISDPRHPVAPNLARKLEAKAPNQLWLVDITYVATKEGWLYIAGVLDIYSRKNWPPFVNEHRSQESEFENSNAQFKIRARGGAKFRDVFGDKARIPHNHLLVKSPSLPNATKTYSLGQLGPFSPLPCTRPNLAQNFGYVFFTPIA
jgi:hypothetical protein